MSLNMGSGFWPPRRDFRFWFKLSSSTYPSSQCVKLPLPSLLASPGCACRAVQQGRRAQHHARARGKGNQPANEILSHVFGLLGSWNLTIFKNGEMRLHKNAAWRDAGGMYMRCVSVSLCVWNSRQEGTQGRVVCMGIVHHAVLLCSRNKFAASSKDCAGCDSV